MYKAEYSIKVLTFAGVYRPLTWSSLLKRNLYNSFTLIIIILFYSFDISMFTYITLHSLNDIDDFTESLCWFLAAAVSCMKMTNFLLRGRDIVKLVKLLNQDCLKTRDGVEEILQEKCDIIARRNTKYFFIICIVTVSALTFGGLARDKISLPMKASFPYDYSKKLPFYLTYVSQSLSIYFAAFISVGSETFVMTMIIQICCQLDIIYHRLQNLPHLHQNNEKSTIHSHKKEAEIIKDCVLHHNCIYRFSCKLNSIFNIVFGIQLSGSMLNICTLIFSLSTKNEINSSVIIQSLALTTVLFQVYLYCHFGNEVMLKSMKLANITSMMDWTVLTRNAKHQILLICLRASRPIIMTSASIIPMTYDTFLMILRTSYAAYNLIKNLNS